MTLIAYPFDAQNITEADYGQLIGAGLLSGIVGSPTSNNFKVVATSGMVLTVTSVSGASLALVRGHACVMTANEALTVAAASAAPRVDLVVLQLDYAANTIKPVIKTGTSGSQTPPSPVWGSGGIYEIALATIAVANGTLTITSAMITDQRSFAGATVGAWQTSRRPAGKPSLGYNMTTSTWEATFDGTNWVDVSMASHTLDSHPGTLSVGKGGTGASTPVGAQKGLDIYAQSSAPSHAAGRIWIKLP
jgi:hypothetical protein